MLFCDRELRADVPKHPHEQRVQQDAKHQRCASGEPVFPADSTECDKQAIREFKSMLANSREQALKEHERQNKRDHYGQDREIKLPHEPTRTRLHDINDFKYGKLKQVDGERERGGE